MSKSHDQIIANLSSEIFSEDEAGNLVVEKVPSEAANSPRLAAPVPPGKRGVESQASAPRYRRAVKVQDDGELFIFKSRVVRGSDLLIFLKYLRENVHPKMLKHVGMAISPDIRRRGWKGVWRDGESYFEGQEVTWNGVRWFALKDYPTKPGDPDSGWQMTEKSRR